MTALHQLHYNRHPRSTYFVAALAHEESRLHAAIPALARANRGECSWPTGDANSTGENKAARAGARAASNPLIEVL